MTRDEILAMEPGNELDRLVAERVMGWKYSTPEEYMWFTPHHYIVTAMKVVEKVMKVEKAHFEIELFHDSRIDGRVSIHDREDKEDILLPFGKDQKAGFPKTLTEAICKAALLAVLPKAPDSTAHAQAKPEAG